MQQTPAHEAHNPDLLSLLPEDAKRLIEVGCSSGALAREYKRINSGCVYSGVEIDADYAKLAERHCDIVINQDIETADESFFQSRSAEDCWIFGDTLEHLKDPWLILSRIRNVMPADGCIVACIPNAQHWSIQAQLSCGDFRYQDSGLLDRTHLRWFTRKTIIEMFASAGFKIANGIPRIFLEPSRDKMLDAIKALAALAGGDPEMAVTDAIPLQYVVKAVPV
jgi:Methyltransferase domain